MHKKLRLKRISPEPHTSRRSNILGVRTVLSRRFRSPPPSSPESYFRTRRFITGIRNLNGAAQYARGRIVLKPPEPPTVRVRSRAACGFFRHCVSAGRLCAGRLDRTVVVPTYKPRTRKRNKSYAINKLHDTPTSAAHVSCVGWPVTNPPPPPRGPTARVAREGRSGLSLPLVVVAVVVVVLKRHANRYRTTGIPRSTVPRSRSGSQYQYYIAWPVNERPRDFLFWGGLDKIIWEYYEYWEFILKYKPL